MTSWYAPGMRRLGSSLVVAALSLAPALARADIPPPNTGGCSGKSAGSACTTDDGKKGACAANTCQRRTMFPDGGFGMEDYTCMTCVASADSTSGGSSTGGSSGGQPTGSSSGGSASSGGSSKSGCGVGPREPGDAMGAVVALGMALAFVAARRRRA